ncbi:MAG TPA: aldehyde dehydrogenase EutE, partial [Candidatus Avimonas sp.]|nr:aldehyde dehydrogenase EutE [Candidatus Avimonas sp.]HQD38883.1 aldehyde dehydrogenase EutE [Candidatus Avimonas sp.]
MSEINRTQIEEIVRRVLYTINNKPGAGEKDFSSTSYKGRALIGIFSDMNDAIEQVSQSYKAVRAMSVEQRERIICAIRELTRKEAQAMAELGVLETGMGKVEHKRLKHLLVADKTPGTEDLVSHAKTGDHGLTLVEMAPYG